MASAESTSRGITTELQVLSYDDPVLEYDKTGALEQSSRILLKPNQKNGTITPSPAGTRKAPKPPLVYDFVTTKRPNRVGERAGNAQGAEPRLPLKRGASGPRKSG
jgi:hypothetical protein